MRRLHWTLMAVSTALSLSSLRAAEDLVVADFEGRDYGEWKTTGDAFGPGPARGAMPGQMAVDGFQGKGLVNSFFKGDGSTGTLTSPPFTVARPYLKFLIGGGGFEGKTCMQLLVDRVVVRAATGPNTQPGGSERLEPQGWDVREFAGKQAVIRIVDDATGGWGHINVDQIVQSDQRAPGFVRDAARSVMLDQRYLNLPVKNDGPVKRVTVTVEGGPMREFDVRLADGPADWWAFMDLAAWRGRKATIRVDKMPEDSAGLGAIHQTDEIIGTDTLYREALRPQFHFSSRRGWNNDPNGLVCFQGEYHLFYQHNPYGWDWGNMHWGHAVSADLIHWKELGDALFPDEHGTMFSGSAVVDWDNTAGFQTGPEKPLVCIFTAAGSPFTQGLAFSNDRGRTWTKYPHNPVLPHVKGDNRDPKVLWYPAGKKWLMALYLDGNDYGLFSSRDLKAWEKMSEVSVPGASECPEFFPIAADGDPAKTRWIFYGGNGRYLVGSFDGRSFHPEAGPLALHEGNCWYASQTYTDIPKEDGRRILIPWGTMATPGMPFNQMMGIPVSLSLRTTADGLRLFSNPVRELNSLRGESLKKLRRVPLIEGANPLAGVRAELLDLEAEFALGGASEIGLKLRGVPVNYDAARQELTVQDQKGPLKAADGKIRLRILVDRSSVEVFGNDGRLYLSAGVLVSPTDRSLEAHSKGGSARIESLNAYELKSAWRR